MRKYLFFLLLMSISLVLTSCSSENELAQGLQATVLSVTDGDTIKVELDNGQTDRVRLTLVDSPEMNHPRQGMQPFAKEATEFTSEQLTGKTVFLELDVEERDQYGRVLAYVWVGDHMFNKSLVEQGFARVEVFPPNTKYVDQLKAVEEQAKAGGAGIWSKEGYVTEKGYNPESIKKEGKDENCENQIKGNRNSMIYHVPTGDHYNEVSEHHIVWFCSEEEAQEAGFRAAKR